jgi:hypothetical protein
VQHAHYNITIIKYVVCGLCRNIMKTNMWCKGLSRSTIPAFNLNFKR